jgi:hypothetical protein
MNLKFTDYVKLEGMKQLILAHLESMGLKEQVRVMTDDDVNKIIEMMSYLANELRVQESDEKRIEMMVSYIVALWARLLVNYGANLKEL